ncbi:MAG: hypothetical protein C0525_05390 [Flavobacterium sp.]|nr:hypothetical protein [Flavobacterium sp.]
MHAKFFINIDKSVKSARRFWFSPDGSGILLFFVGGCSIALGLTQYDHCFDEIDKKQKIERTAGIRTARMPEPLALTIN